MFTCRIRCPAVLLLLCLPMLLIAACGGGADAAPATAAPAQPTAATAIAQVEPTPVAPTLAPTEPPTNTPAAAPKESPAATTTEAPKRVVRAQVPAPALEGNLVGEATERLVTVHLPPSYHTPAAAERRYPVIYYLPGYGDSDFIGFYPSRDTDEDVAAGVLPEFVYVVANGVSQLQGSFYADSAVTGDWETFVSEDLVSWVDANFRTLAQPEARALTGHSMGGSGAFNIAVHRPGVFGTVYLLSPGLFDPDGLAESQMFANERAIEAYLAMEESLAAMPPDEAQAAMLRQYGDLGFALSYGAAYAANPTRHPPLVDYPYRRVDGALVRDEQIWAQWESGYGALAQKVAAAADDLKALRGLVIDYGTLDGYAWIPKGSAYLSTLLDEAGIAHEARAFEGGHQEKLGMRIKQFMLPFLAERMVVE